MKSKHHRFIFKYGPSAPFFFLSRQFRLIKMPKQLSKELSQIEDAAFEAGLNQLVNQESLKIKWTGQVEGQRLKAISLIHETGNSIRKNIDHIDIELAKPFEEFVKHEAVKLQEKLNSLIDEAETKTGLLDQRLEAKQEELAKAKVAIDRSVRLIGYTPEKRHFWENSFSVTVGMGIIALAEIPLTFIGLKALGMGNTAGPLLATLLSIILALSCHIFGDYLSHKDRNAWWAALTGLGLSCLIIYIRSMADSSDMPYQSALAWFNIIVYGFGMVLSVFVQRHLPYWNAVDQRFKVASETDAIETEKASLPRRIKAIESNIDKLAKQAANKHIQNQTKVRNKKAVTLARIEVQINNTNKRFESYKKIGEQAIDAAYGRGQKQFFTTSQTQTI